MNSLVVPESSQSSPVQNLLAALGARFVTPRLEECRSSGKTTSGALLLSESQFVELCETAGARAGSLADVLPGFSDILLYPFSGSAKAVEALQRIVGGRVSVAQMSENGTTDYAVAASRSTCGPFAGLRAVGVQCRRDVALRIEGAACPSEPIVTSNVGSLLIKFNLPGLNLFVLSSDAMFDVSAEHLRNLEVSECFSGLVPLLFFLRHCRVDLPTVPLRWAHWVIDDPNLRPRYGFLDLKGLVSSVRETGAAASIAFIPWNYKRTSREIVDLFKQNWPQLSICVHGCDHTGAEFSTKTMSDATPLIDLAMKRMKRLETETSLGWERVMVFPQGRFSGEAMRALRASEMLAAVNTELLDCQTGGGVKGAELLKPAITSFGGFPLFMRRPAEETPANFALDLILGKPCLIVTHHQYFERGLDSLRSAVETLNGLEPELTWTNLERGILSTYSMGGATGEALDVRVYSARTVFVPQAERTLLVSKAETDPETVEVFVDGLRVASSAVNGDIQFAIKSSKREAMTIEARSSVPAKPQLGQSAKYRLKVTARRYLTEVRDNYLSRFPKLTARAASLQQMLYRTR
jgi:hypothetical protein